MKVPKHRRIQSTQSANNMFTKTSFGISGTLTSAMISKKPMIESLCFENHNLNQLTSKKKVGGGFKTNNQSDTKPVIDIREQKLQKLEDEKANELQSKILELQNFTLGLSSSKSSRVC